ncbi:MAG: TonB-dependent receptor [Polyangiales bacterium]
MVLRGKSARLAWGTSFALFSLWWASAEAQEPAPITLDAGLPVEPAQPEPALSDAGAPSEPLLSFDASVPAPEEVAIAAEEEGNQLDAITITARHRVENIQDVPIAVTAVTARDLEASGNFTLRQVQNQVPSLQILGFNPRNVTIQIRGLGTTAGTVNSGIEPGVGVYVNGVYYARPSIAVFDLYDVENIDVLRGPQGTLFGKNTVAGAIDIRTNEASYTPELAAELSYGNYQYSQMKLAASAPLGKSGFAVRIAGIKTDRDGTIYNTLAKEHWQDYHNRGVRGELAYRSPSQRFKARLIADYNDQYHYSGFQVGRGALPKNRADGSVATTRDFYDRARDVGYTPIGFNPSKRQTDLNTPFTVNMQTGGSSLQLDQKLPYGLTATSVTAWRFWDWDPSLDGDRTGAAIAIASNLPTNQRQWSQELRIASASGKKFEYTGGLYYFWQRTKEVPFNTYGRDAGKWFLGSAFPNQSLENFTASGRQLAVMNSYSAFANGTWHALDQLDVNGGLRYTYETRTGEYRSFPLPGAGTPLSDPVFSGLSQAQLDQITARRNAYAPNSEFETEAKGGQVSGTLNALVHITRDINAYAGYSRGFKSAGVNMAQPAQLANGPAPLTFKPEIVDAYELGFKSQLFGRKLTTNLALFLSDDRGYQANQSILVDTATGPVMRQYLTNAGDVRTQGVEVDLRARPVDGLSLTGGLTFNDATFRNYENGQCSYLGTTAENRGICDLSGRQLTGVSKWVYNLAAQYDVDISKVVGFGALAYFGGNWNWRSAYYGTLNTDPYGRVPAYGLLSAFVGLRDPDGRWDLKFWGRNLMDKTYYLNASVDTATTYTYSASLGDPRYIGTTLQVDL